MEQGKKGGKEEEEAVKRGGGDKKLRGANHQSFLCIGTRQGQAGKVIAFLSAVPSNPLFLSSHLLPYLALFPPFDLLHIFSPPSPFLIRFPPGKKTGT